MIPETFIQSLLERVDIVDVVGRYVPLKKAGANYSACCPFHSEKTPSFTVSPTKQFYHCFGCGAHGSAIGFLMQYAGMGFVDTVKELAQSVGMAVPEDEFSSRPRDPDAVSPSQLHEALARAAKFYRDKLKESPEAIAYLKSRGLTGEVAARFGIGFAPDDWQALRAVFPDYQHRALLEAGLVIENDQGRRYDRFRGRIMFPIANQKGEMVGFGGRVMGQGEPKYLNSPETPVFSKGRELYGLPQARQALRETNTAIVVEGYMDVVALAQHGVPNAVAALGTATTGDHVHKLLRQVDRVVFCFDGDAAGRKAAWRALEASLPQLADNKLIGFCFLPPEHDPDSFVRENGAPAFAEAIRQAVPLADFLLRELAARVDLETAEGRSHLLFDAKPLVEKVQAGLLKLQLVKALASAAQLEKREAEQALGIKPQWNGRRDAPPRQLPRRPPSPKARKLLVLAAQRPEFAARVPPGLIADDSAEGAALQALTDKVAAGRLVQGGGVGSLLEHFRDTEHEAVFAGIVSEITENYFDDDSIEIVFTDTLRRLEAERDKQALDKLLGKARAGLTAEEQRQMSELLRRVHAARNVRRESD